MTTAIVGAGMAGAACARRLREFGHDVVVFDKGRSIGGRMAQRRRDDALFDHGAQYFTARDGDFRSLVMDCVDAGTIVAWPLPHKSGEECFVGVPSMSQPVKTLLDGIEVHLSTRIATIGGNEGAWSLVGESGQRWGPFTQLVVAVPQPQAHDLLQSSIQTAGMAGDIEAASLAPCWSGLMALTAPLDWPNGPIDDPILAWAARNNSKPGRGAVETWTVHAGHDWSRAHLEADKDDIATKLKEAFERCVGELPETCHLEAHRWRYAFVDTPLGVDATLSAGGTLAVCGDWFLGPRVEAAFLSGRAAAARLVKASGTS